ncbi:MAG: hypothetical protein GY811_23870 [Myxococcales bacterium]|nr:hypothetical protein [Myxococcales bacterium]
MRAIVANFDCELVWAQAHSPGPHKTLPKVVRRAVSELSQSLRVFAREDDSLFTLCDLAEGIPPALKNAGEVLLWGQTLQHHGKPSMPSQEAPWQEQLWLLGCDADVAAACNDRRFAAKLALPPELELGSVRVVESIEELDAYVERGELGPDQSWVAKAPWSASGRERLTRRGREVEGEQRTFAKKLLQRYGALLVEPWMQRTGDFAVCGLIGETAESCTIFPAHQLHCDRGGVFRGIRIDDEQTQAMLGPHNAPLMQCAHLVAGALRRRGYRGAFGIDSFLYQDSSGTRLRAVCEINARMTFGLVARAIASGAGELTCDFAPSC